MKATIIPPTRSTYTAPVSRSLPTSSPMKGTLSTSAHIARPATAIPPICNEALIINYTAILARTSVCPLRLVEKVAVSGAKWSSQTIPGFLLICTTGSNLSLTVSALPRSVTGRFSPVTVNISNDKQIKSYFGGVKILTALKKALQVFMQTCQLNPMYNY